MTQDTSHLIALISRLGNERARLDAAKTAKEVALRTVWVAQLEREVAAEERFLGMLPVEPISDDELMAELAGF